MKIIARKAEPLALTAVVKKLAKYIYDNLDEAYKWTNGPNQCDVYLNVVDEFGEVVGQCDVNITTYGTYIRVNILDMKITERTIGYKRYDGQDFQYSQDNYKIVVAWIEDRLDRYYF